MKNALMCVGWFVMAALLPARPIEVGDLFRLGRVADPQVSPDGRWVAYVVTEVLKDENRTQADIWLTAADGRGEPRKLTSSPRHDRHPRALLLSVIPLRVGPRWTPPRTPSPAAPHSLTRVLA